MEQNRHQENQTKNETKNQSDKNNRGKYKIQFEQENAEQLANLPLKCLQTQYPNKTSQTLEVTGDLGTPKELHPAFYGCFDWHSSVHGHWSLIEILKIFPELNQKEKILIKLGQNLKKENIQGEIEYFNRSQEYSFERMYGWAWLLKLQEALNTWEIEEAKEWRTNLQPLSDLIINRFLEFLPKLQYPIRVGTHNNTAFALSFAYDYALQAEHEDLQKMIRSTAKRFFLSDKDCPISWEPDGYDFLSPCIEELGLMHKILSKDEFTVWAKSFLPLLSEEHYDIAVAQVSDRTDGHLVHLDGLNFSRAWTFYALARDYPQRYGHLKDLADKHLSYSLENLYDGNYEGEHWLASFALQALMQSDK